MQAFEAGGKLAAGIGGIRVADQTIDNAGGVQTPVQLWHIPVKLDAQSDVPSDWSGTVAEWLSLQVASHAVSVTITDDQFATLMQEAPFTLGPKFEAVSPEAFSAFEASDVPPQLETMLPPSHVLLDFHGLIQPVLA